VRLLLSVGCGGALGALARYGLAGLVHRFYGGFLPVGTLVVNVLGCLLIGAAAALVEDRGLFSPELRLFLLVGFLGSFTTFSTFGHETVALLREGSFLAAAGNASLQLLLGLAAVVAGRGLIHLLLP